MQNICPDCGEEALDRDPQTDVRYCRSCGYNADMLAEERAAQTEASLTGKTITTGEEYRELYDDEPTDGGMCSACGVDCAHGTWRCNDCEELDRLMAEYDQMQADALDAHHEQLNAQETNDGIPGWTRQTEQCEMAAFWRDGPSEDAEF